MQRELREIAGRARCIIYDQTCATEKRRRRKRGKYGRSGQARRHQRAGLRRLRRLRREVELPVGRAGRDRVRPQARASTSRLQQGLLLRQGLLPELRHGRRRPAEASAKTAAKRRAADVPALPEPALPLARAPYGILVTGIGGTGVITIGPLLGMAAHLEGKGVSRARHDGPGAEERRRDVARALARAAGRPARHAHRHRRRRPGDRLRPRGHARAPRRIAKMATGRTRAVVNATVTPTAEFVQQPELAASRRGPAAATSSRPAARAPRLRRRDRARQRR